MGSPVRPQLPSGGQHEIRRGEHRAVVTEVGATLRHYSVGGDDVIDGSDEGERASDGRGQVLAPWPNRLDEGRYRFGDRDARAALDEPDRNNAIHGLVRWIPVDRSRLLIPARRRLVTDERGLPIGDEPVAGTELDFIHPATVGSTRLDTGFTDLVRGPDGLARAEVSAPAGGRAVGVWVDAWFRYLMVYTGDTVQQTSRRRCSVAIEPMTCPPNALRTGTDVAAIEPGDHVGGRWGLTPSRIPGGGAT